MLVSKDIINDLYNNISEEKLKTTMESDIKWIIDFIDELDLTNDLFKR